MTTQHIEQAAQFAPIVERVHGANHPELTRVRELTEAIHNLGETENASELFAELREVTNNYALPADACEAFTATYESLNAADEAYAA